MSGGRGERCMVVGVGNIGKVICSALFASEQICSWLGVFLLFAPWCRSSHCVRNNVVCMYKFKSWKSRFPLVIGEKLTGWAPAFNFKAMAEAVHRVLV
jgi:hypothetical protein